MNDIMHYYIENNGGFWIATDDNDDVIGTLGLMNKYPNPVFSRTCREFNKPKPKITFVIMQNQCLKNV